MRRISIKIIPVSLLGIWKKMGLESISLQEKDLVSLSFMLLPREDGLTMHNWSLMLIGVQGIIMV